MLELALVDGTRLRLVGASTLVLESFEWNPATGAGRAALRLVSGAMEVQLGAIADSAPNLFMVNTPYGFVTGSQSAFIVIVEPAVNGAGMLVHDLGAGGVVARRGGRRVDRWEPVLDGGHGCSFWLLDFWVWLLDLIASVSLPASNNEHE